MASANWACIALLLSLCLGLCYGNRAGLVGQHSTMDHVVKNDVVVVAKDDNRENVVDHAKNMVSTIGNIIDEGKRDKRPQPPKLLDLGFDLDGVYCPTDGCEDHIIVSDPRQFIVGCDQLSGYSQCQWRLNDVDTIRDYISGIKAKLDETCWYNSIDSMNMAATTTTTSAMPPN